MTAILRSCRLDRSTRGPRFAQSALQSWKPFFGLGKDESIRWSLASRAHGSAYGRRARRMAGSACRARGIAPCARAGACAPGPGVRRQNASGSACAGSHGTRFRRSRRLDPQGGQCPCRRPGRQRCHRPRRCDVCCGKIGSALYGLGSRQRQRVARNLDCLGGACRMERRVEQRLRLPLARRRPLHGAFRKRVEVTAGLGAYCRWASLPTSVCRKPCSCRSRYLGRLTIRRDQSLQPLYRQ